MTNNEHSNRKSTAAVKEPSSLAFLSSAADYASIGEAIREIRVNVPAESLVDFSAWLSAEREALEARFASFVTNRSQSKSYNR